MTSALADAGRPVPATSLAALRDRVRGAVWVPGDHRYASARQVWNGHRQRRPAVIIAATTTADIVAAVRFAREQQRPLTVRAGGYSPAGMSSSDGVVLDLRALHAVRADPREKQAVVAGGALWRDVDVATQRFGLAVPGAAVAGIGVAGSTLSGGFGHLRRAYGLACDNLLSAEVVDADGKVFSTSGDVRPELLWGLRGGGGNFGVVSSLRFRLRPLPEPVLSGTVFFPVDHAPELLRFYREWCADLPDDVTTGVAFFGGGYSPELIQLIGARPGVPLIGITVLCAGHRGEADSVIRALRAAGPVLRDLIAVHPYTDVQAMPDAVLPAGRPAMMDSGYLGAVDDDVISALCERHERMVSGACELHLQHMGGAVSRVARMSTAVPNRGAQFFFSALARWADGEDGSGERQWLADTGTRLRQLTVGGPHVGMRSAEISSVDVYGAERYLRLGALKRGYDPDNVFAGNQNVAPLV